MFTLYPGTVHVVPAVEIAPRPEPLSEPLERYSRPLSRRKRSVAEAHKQQRANTLDQHNPLAIKATIVQPDSQAARCLDFCEISVPV